MIDNPDTPESAPDGLLAPVPGNGEQKAGGQEIRTRKKKKRIAFISIVVTLVVGSALWAGYVSLQLSRAPVTLPQLHDHEVARSNILELQALALSEAKAGRPAFFVTHIGCASPPVWQNERVLQNLKRMVDAKLDVKLIGGLTGHDGEVLPSADWPRQFLVELTKLGIADILHMYERELPNHSAVSGSAQRRLAYICIAEEKNIYPTKYFRVRDNKGCEQWQKYLVEEWRKRPVPQKKILSGDKPTSRSQ